MIVFITHSRNKLIEAQSVIPELEQLNINLPEIQTLDPYKLVREKALAARNHSSEALVIEDTSLYIRGLNNLPGTLRSFTNLQLNLVMCKQAQKQ